MMGVIFAQAGVTQFDATALVQYGLGGTLFMLAILGYIRFKPEVERLFTDKVAAERQRDDLIKTSTEQTLPALREAAEANHKMADALVSLAGEVKTLRVLIEDRGHGRGRDGG